LSAWQETGSIKDVSGVNRRLWWLVTGYKKWEKHVLIWKNDRKADWKKKVLK